MKDIEAPKQSPRLAKPVKKWCAVDHYSANEEDEADLDVDEEVTEIKPDDGGWTLIKKEDGSEGLVPSDFLGILYNTISLLLLSHKLRCSTCHRAPYLHWY